MARNLTTLIVMLIACPSFAAAPTAEAPAKNIVETAIEAGSFNTLVAAVKAAGLVETLSGPGPFTVFAPTDEAFGTLPKGTVAELLKPENKGKLTKILTYHVVSGRVTSDQALSLDSASTVAGPAINIVPTEAGGKINDASLVTTDIETSNGVIHIVDRVLLPPPTPETVSTIPDHTGSNRSSAETMLRTAIQQGVPAYNSGHHGMCAEIYINALQNVASMSDTGLSSNSISQTWQTIDRCRQMHNMSSRAWELRHQMDRLIMEL